MNIMVEFQLVVAGVTTQSLSDMSWSGYNFPESPHMMRTRWLWLLEMGVSSAVIIGNHQDSDDRPSSPGTEGV